MFICFILAAIGIALGIMGKFKLYYLKTWIGLLFLAISAVYGLGHMLP